MMSGALEQVGKMLFVPQSAPQQSVPNNAGIAGMTNLGFSQGATNATPDPYDQAVQTATQQYPWLKRMGVPIKLISGTGPYMSESYDPKAEENPHPGSFTVELRNDALKKDQSQWAPALAREGMDYMARHDPVFQSTAQQFRQMMTPDQLQRSRNRYEKEQKTGETRSFEDFMKGAELQEFIGGYVFDMKGWRDVKWTPEQRKLLDGLKAYMWQGQTPTSVNIP